MACFVSPHLPNWNRILRDIQSNPLKFHSDFPTAAARWNAWWRQENDRPLIVAQTAKPAVIRRDKLFDLLDDPCQWINLRRRQVEETHFAGEALPHARVDIGPVSMGAYLGAPLHIAPGEQTTWQTPIIQNWPYEPALHETPWLQKVLDLLEMLAEDARDNYLVCLPDLTGAIDTLANLRGSEALCMDLYEEREEVIAAAAKAVDAWEEVFTRAYDRVLGAGAGITQWVSCWSESPFTVPTCDFNALIGPSDFKEVCMPSLKEQARRAEQCCFHLDGPDAARHAEALAEDPDITAVQFTPGAGTPSALAHLPMFKMLQAHDTSLFIECPIEETKELAQSLDPAGLAIRPDGLRTPKEADDLVAWRDREFG